MAVAETAVCVHMKLWRSLGPHRLEWIRLCYFCYCLIFKASAATGGPLTNPCRRARWLQMSQELEVTVNKAVYC